MKKIIIVFFILVGLKGISQTTLLAKYTITGYSYNKIDQSDLYINKNVSITISNVDGSLMMMINDFPANMEWYGALLSSTNKDSFQESSIIKYKRYAYFLRKISNDEVGKNRQADIAFLFSKDPTKKTVTCVVVTEKEVIEYRGFIEYTIPW